LSEQVLSRLWNLCTPEVLSRLATSSLSGGGDWLSEGFSQASESPKRPGPWLGSQAMGLRGREVRFQPSHHRLREDSSSPRSWPTSNRRLYWPAQAHEVLELCSSNHRLQSKEVSGLRRRVMVPALEGVVSLLLRPSEIVRLLGQIRRAAWPLAQEYAPCLKRARASVWR